MPTENTGPYYSLGLRVAAYRTRSGLSQTDLAALLGTSQGRVSQIETGKERPTKAQAIQLSEDAGIAAGHWDRIERAIIQKEN